MQNKIPDEYVYISISSNTYKDVRQMNTEYLINALAKCHREIYNKNNVDDFIKEANNITNLEDELLSRQKEYFNKTFFQKKGK